MTLGEKIKKARLDRHMTQREVVGDYITRNMLSKIENNSATPSMKTLEYLAGKLGLPAGYFVSEEVLAMVPVSMQSARQAYAAGDIRSAINLLEQVESTEMQDEKQMLLAKCHLHMAETAGRSNEAEEVLLHARAALEANAKTIYASVTLEAKAYLLVARFDAEAFDSAMEQSQRALQQLGIERLYHLTMTQHYLVTGDTQKAAEALDQLDRSSNRQETDYLRLQGELSMQQQDYHLAAEQLRRAEQLAVTAGSSEPALSPLYAMLEQCYREMEDYKEAYHYASKQIQR